MSAIEAKCSSNRSSEPEKEKRYGEKAATTGITDR
jgi:hypothetical protein